MTKNPPHRPYGSGSTAITIRQRPDNPGVWLFIGRALWQRIGSPDRVRLSGAAGQWLLEATDAGDGSRGYRVSGAGQNTIPRLSVGRKVATALGLTDGTYQAQAYPLRHLILFWQAHE